MEDGRIPCERRKEGRPLKTPSALLVSDRLPGHAQAGRGNAADDVLERPPLKYFTVEQFQLLTELCQSIIPPDDRSGGAIEAGAPAFIDLIVSEHKDYQLHIGGGLLWLNSTCVTRYGCPYLECSENQKREMLDGLAWREHATIDPSLAPGIHFFSVLRKLTVDAFVTSEPGMRDLGYVGNTSLDEFVGCPPIHSSENEDTGREGI